MGTDKFGAAKIVIINLLIANYLKKALYLFVELAVKRVLTYDFRVFRVCS
jgi:hypothetical protein